MSTRHGPQRRYNQSFLSTHQYARRYGSLSTHPRMHETSNLLQLDDAPELLLLDLKRSNIQMSNSSKAAPLDNAQSCTGIDMQPNQELHTAIPHKRYEADALCRNSKCGQQPRFRRAPSNGTLSLRPNFMQHLPTTATPPLVDFLAVLQPAQFASIKMSMCVASGCQSNLIVALGRPRT